MKKKIPTLQERLEYIKFLETRLNSENFKKNVSAEEFKKTEEKLAKERFLVKLLK